MTETFVTIAGLLADDAPRNTGPDFGKASPLGLLVIVLLLIGVFLLVRSMNRHLKRVPESFDRGEPEPDQAEKSDTKKSDTKKSDTEKSDTENTGEAAADDGTVEPGVEGKSPE